MRFPQPPLVASWISGFVVGVILTLLVSGTLGNGAASKRDSATTPVPVTSLAYQTFETRVQRLATRVLGPAYPTGPKTRFLHVTVLSVTARDVGVIPPNVEDKYRSIEVRFRLNDHPLGTVWRLREAKADVFALLKAIYTSGLPVYNTELVGEFAPSGKKPYAAIVTYLSYQTALKVPWKRWGRTNEGRFWNLLDYKDISRQFA